MSNLSDPDAAYRRHLDETLDQALEMRGLGPDERAVVANIVDRMITGRAVYGELNLATDGRDWRKERYEELLDAMIYQECERLQKALTASEVIDELVDKGIVTKKGRGM